jgi:hypothetical protein
MLRKLRVTGKYALVFDTKEKSPTISAAKSHGDIIQNKSR